MNPERRNLALRTADAAARRILMRVMDLRFDLEDAAETPDGGPGLPLEDLWLLRAEADLLCREIDALVDTLWPTAHGVPDEMDPECEEVTEVCGT